MAIRLRRPLALASVVTATLAGAVVLRSIFAGGGEDQPAPLVSPSAAAAPTGTAPATAGATATAPPLRAVTSPLEKRVFAAGEQVTVRDGIGFLSAADGSLETWSFPGAGNTFYSLQASPDGALLIFVQAKEGAPTVVVDRATGRAWELDERMSVLPGAGHGALFILVRPSAEGAELLLSNAADGSVRPLGVRGEPGGFGVTSPDGRKVALRAGDSIYLIDLGTATSKKVAGGVDPGASSVRSLPGALGFAVEVMGATARRWFGWDGVEVPGGLAFGAVSPNGRYIASAWSPGRIKAFGMGGFPVVSAVTIVDRQPDIPLSQYLGAGVALARFGDSAWMSTSDSLVVEVADGYRLVSPTGQVLASFDDPVHVLNPRPSFALAGLLGTDRGTIINVARNQTIAPKYAEQPWYAEWTQRPGELAVQLATPGKGRSWPEQVLPFEARKAPVSLPPKVAVATQGGCAELRSAPDSAATLVRCVPGGSTATLSLADDPKPDPKAEGQPKEQYAGFRDETGTLWLHLTVDGGESGWANAKSVGWAK